MSDDQEQAEKQDGSVWTSYSDLFMAIAVVFLIMFVFSILAAGIQKVRIESEKIAEQEYQMGKVPEEIKDQNQKDMEEITDSIAQIEEKKKVLERNVKEIKQLATLLKKKETSFLRIKEDHLKKETMLESARTELEIREQRIEDLEQLTRKLKTEKEENEKVSKREKSELEQKLTKKVEKLKKEKVEELAKLKTEQDKKIKEIVKETSTNISELKKSQSR